MSAQHTPGPIRIGREGSIVSDTPVPEINGSDCVEYYGGHLIAESVSKANARRLVACWNACDGIIDPENVVPRLLALNELVPDLENQAATLRVQRDELLAALEACVAHGIFGSDKDHIRQKARAAIAKVKGGAA